MYLNKLFTVLGLFLFFISQGQTGNKTTSGTRPNIIFILVDELRYNALSCMGHPFVKTPNIDRLAKEGMLMKNAYITTPVCSPSRATFFTGQYAQAHGVIKNTKYNAMTHKMITYPLLLKQSGYSTAFIGKWHMGDDYTPRPGFDRWVCAGGNKEPKVNSPMNIDGQTIQTEGHVTDVLTDETIKFIRGYANKEKPFCISLFHKAVHGPYVPSERNKDLYKDQPIVRTLSATTPVVGKPALVGKNGQPPESDNAIRNQLRTLVDIDDGVGRILKALEELKILDKTFIVFTSDNGYLWGEHGQGQKRLAYEESIKVPMLVRYPALVKAGSTSEASILNIDFAPTFLDLASVPMHTQMRGQSFLPVLKGQHLKNRESLLFEYYLEPTGIPSWKAVRTDRYKYINYTDLTDCNELYDLKQDPKEMNNLIKKPESVAVIKNMEKELQRLVTAFK